MQPGVLRALEFDRIVDAVRAFAVTPMGEEVLGRLAPSPDAARVAQLQAATTETVDYGTKYGAFPLRAAGELPQVLAALSVQGRALEAERLLALATFLDSVTETCAGVRRAGTPILERVIEGVASFAQEAAAVRDTIDESGLVVDTASPALREIRDRLRKQKTRLKGTLESYLRGRDTSKYLQDQIVTERNGRYVLVVRAEHRSSIPGIVHGASTSGASLYLEPLSTVEINNDIVALEERESEEVRRILLALSDRFRARAAELVRAVDAATDLDVLQARARFSQSIDGVQPILSADGSFELLSARHPLLKAPVPVTIRIERPATILLVTGPNTGGKTVAIKTAGLLALMAQSGLRIPAAAGSRLPVFRTVFADIGDEQSIDASLSTFSGHISNIAAMDRGLAVPALVLLDEVGSGTDPIEGGALGVAIVDHFRRRGATVIATSHYDALKTYASTTAGVACAAFGFDPATFAPTYQLVFGSPGRSLAIEIASRLGLHPSIVAAARSNISARETQLAAQLARMDADLRSLDEQRQNLAAERARNEALERQLRQRQAGLDEREQELRRRLREDMDKQRREARREIDQVIAGLRSKTAAIVRDAARQPVTTGDAGGARSEARAAIDAVVERVVDPAGAAEAATAAEPARPSVPVAVGDRVVLTSLGLEGVVTGIQGGSADLDVRGKRMRARLRDLRSVGGPAPTPRVSVNVDLKPRDSSPSDLNVIGCTVDEALTRAERFLDEALLGDQHTLRIVHGYGTGQLKRALSGFLQQHPLVLKYAPAPPEQGGGGVTVVELKE